MLLMNKELTHNNSEYNIIFNNLEKLKAEIAQVENTKDLEIAINKLDVIKDTYKKQKDISNEFLNNKEIDEDIKTELKNKIYDVGFKLSILEDEFECKGWEIFNKKVSYSFSGHKESFRKAQVSDAELLAKWWNDGNIMEHAGFPDGLGITVNEVRDKIVNRNFYNLLFIICYNKEPIGELSANIKDGVADFGIKICNAEYQNKGIGTFVMRKFFKELFKNDNVNKISISTNKKNTRAIYVYKNKLNAELVKEFEFKDANGEMQQGVEFELTKEHWKEINNRGK